MDVPLEMGSLVYFFTLTIVESFKEIKKTKNKDLKLLTIVYFFWTNEGFKGTLKKNYHGLIYWKKSTLLLYFK